MTLEKSVTDDQLGRFHRRIRAIEDRLGKSVPYDEGMYALQCLHNGTLRIGRNAAEDLQELCSRPLGAANVLKLIHETWLSELAGMPLDLCFVNRHRYPRPMWVHKDLEYKSLALHQPAQSAGLLRVYAVVSEKPNATFSDTLLAAELLGVSEEVPTQWLQQLLIRRGYTLTIPAIEHLIGIQMQGTDLGLLPYRKDPCYRPSFRAFVETAPGVVDAFACYRIKRRQWTISRDKFWFHGVGGCTSHMGDTRIVVRAPPVLA